MYSEHVFVISLCKKHYAHLSTLSECTLKYTLITSL
ncbi:unnamed protein product [Chironomus riparius]|uniref:Uncharacterized protein n=1 Tax=Chironomus riparius TaxID=315576 RepID=A0A9N9RWW0_9DIPT|nr:unnamed protein product [Chironomus riparius]